MKLTTGSALICMTDSVYAYWVEVVWKLKLTSVNGGWVGGTPDSMEMYDWTVSNFGSPAYLFPREGCRWTVESNKYYFRNEADRTLFLLRWG